MLLEGLTAVTLVCCSYHTDRHAGYNEFNPGVVAEFGPYVGGIYYNSLRKTTVLAGRTFDIYDFGPVKTDVLFAAATGYRSPVIGLFRARYGELLVNFAPSSGGKSGKVGAIFALGWRHEFK